MIEYRLIVTYFIVASVYVSSKDVESKPTATQKTPELKTRFFGLENIFGNMFHGANYPSNGGFGGQFQFMPQYQNQQYPQGQFNNWQNQQTPNQAQSNLDQYQQSTPYPQAGFNSQNNFGPSNLNIQSPQQFPNQQDFNQPSGEQYPSQSMQGNFNSGNFNPGTIDGIPSQNGINQANQPAWNPGSQGIQNGQMANKNEGNQLGSQTQNGLGVQSPQNTGDYNPVAILGKPVPITTSVPDTIVFEDGCDTPMQRQCVQDCQSSTEYKPVCGSNNVTYFNPGRFICARNCGINVFIERPGRCDT